LIAKCSFKFRFIALLLIVLHFFGIKIYRKAQLTKKNSWVVIAGSIIIPLFILISYIISYGVIDSIIGEEAGRYHGYIFLVIVLYPVLLPIYWVLMWFVDKKIKERNS